MTSRYFVYMLTTRKNTVLYTGVTGDLDSRMWQHKQHMVDGFTKKYNVDKLVYMEEYDQIEEALQREKCIKRWKREWKNNLVNKANPNWNDLYDINAIPACAGMTGKEDTRIVR